MLQSLRAETEEYLQMLSSLRKNGLTSLFKEVRVFKVLRTCMPLGTFPCASVRSGQDLVEFGKGVFFRDKLKSGKSNGGFSEGGVFKITDLSSNPTSQ